MKMKKFRTWACEMFIKYDTNVTFEELHRRRNLNERKRISYLINFESEEQREVFRKLIGVIKYKSNFKSNIEVTEAMIEALRSFEKGLK